MFSDDGKQRTDFGVGISRAAATAIQPDGKIVAVGVQFSSVDPDFAITRYNPNGTLDTSFSGDGKQTTDFGAFDSASGVAVQDDGKIVAVGSRSSQATEDFALARYNPNGSLDLSFSGDGKQTTDFGGRHTWASAVALQANGKIVAVGRAPEVSGVNGDFALARYNPNGTLDTSFSGDGKQTTDFGASDGASGVAVQADGRIVTVGFAISEAGEADFALARYNPNGNLDTAFSGDGTRRTDFGGGSDQANGVALQANGKIVAVGVGGSGSGSFAIARYNSNGSLDTSFSGDGKRWADFADGGEATGVVLQANGKIVSVGGDGNYEFALARFNPNGSLDTTFSGDGKQTTDFGGEDEAKAVALQAGGKLIAVGDGGNVDFALARYNPNGSLDSSFSIDGKQTTAFGGVDEAKGVAIQANGKIVVVGCPCDGPGDFQIARYNPSGSLDTSFSGDGRQTTDFGGFDRATAVAVQADGKIVVVGYAVGAYSSSFALARYNPNGSLDTSFSGDGKQTTFFESLNTATGVELQADGKIVVAGESGDDIAFNFDFAVARFNPDGTLDTSFSSDGKQTTDFGSDSDGAGGVALQGDGKIVAAGSADGGATGDEFALARYNGDGTLDTTFSDDGKQTTDFGFGADDAANDIAIQGDGKILAVGLASGGGTGSDFALARYDASGLLDPSFSGDGKRRTNFGGDDEASGVALQADGKIVAVGRGLGADGTSDFALARYLGG
jgi:uncharacterized delta-60 repeat protein